MNKYIARVELGEDASDFAQIIGVRGFYGNRYICEAIDSEYNRINMQTFSMQKSIEGLPPNNSALTEDVIASWKSEEAKRKLAQGLEAE